MNNVETVFCITSLKTLISGALFLASPRSWLGLNFGRLFPRLVRSRHQTSPSSVSGGEAEVSQVPVVEVEVAVEYRCSLAL